MKEVLRKIYYSIISVLPAKLVINIENFRTYRRFLSKDNPQYFGEKIQWLKLYGNLEQYSDYVDKYKVRAYIEKKIGAEYLIPLIGAYDDINEIEYEKLPQSFVFKNNNGSAMNLIVKDKNKLDILKTNKKLKKWLKSKYYKRKKEKQYLNVKNKILCEKYISDRSGNLLDYKFFCFDGNPVFVKVDFDRYSNHTSNFYNMNWEKIEMNEQGYKSYKGKVEKPENFDKMVEIAKILSSDFQFIRVDLYNVDGQIYFGELTFTPASGKNSFQPIEKDLEYARRIKIG